MMKSLFGGSSSSNNNNHNHANNNVASTSSPSSSSASTSRNHRMRSLSKSSNDLSRLANSHSSGDDANYLSYRQAAANKSHPISNQASSGVGGMPSSSSTSHSHSHDYNHSSSSPPPASNGLVTSLKSKGKRAIQKFEDSISPNNSQFTSPNDFSSSNHSGFTSPNRDRVNGAGVGVVRRGSTGSNLLLSSPTKPIDTQQDWPDRAKAGSRGTHDRSHPPTSYSSTWRNRSSSRDESLKVTGAPLVILGSSAKSRSRSPSGENSNSRQHLSESPTSTFPTSTSSVHPERSDNTSRIGLNSSNQLISPSSSSTLSPSTSTSGMSTNSTTAPSGSNSFSTSNTTTVSLASTSKRSGLSPTTAESFASTSRLSPRDHHQHSRPLSSISFTSEIDSVSDSNEHLDRSSTGKRNRSQDDSHQASHKSSFSTLKGRFGTLTSRNSNHSSSTTTASNQNQSSSLASIPSPNGKRSNTAPLPPPSSYSFTDSNPQQPKSILAPPTRSLAEQLNEMAVANGDGLLSDEEYRLLRTSLFERLEKGEKEIPVESAIRGGGMERGGRVMGRDDVFTKDAILRAQHSHGDLLGKSSKTSLGSGGGGAASLRDGSTRSQRSSVSNMASLFRRATSKTSRSSEVDGGGGGDYPYPQSGNGRPPSSFNAPPTSPGKRPSTTGSINGAQFNNSNVRNGGTSFSSSGGGDRDSFSGNGNGKAPSFTSSFSKFRSSNSAKVKAENMERTVSSARSARSLQAVIGGSGGTSISGGGGGGRSQSVLGVSSNTSTGNLLLSSPTGMLQDPNGEATPEELKAEISIVEAEGKRLIESFNGLEQVSISKYNLDLDQLRRAYAFDREKPSSMISVEMNNSRNDLSSPSPSSGKEEKKSNNNKKSMSSSLGFNFGRKRLSGENQNQNQNKDKELNLNKLFLNPPPSSYRGPSSPTTPISPTKSFHSANSNLSSNDDDPRFLNPNPNTSNSNLNLNEEEIELQIEKLSLELKEIFKRKEDLIKRYEERLGLLKSKLRSASIKETVRNR